MALAAGPTDADKAGMAADALRLLNKADALKAQAPSSAAEGFLAPTPAATIADADYERMLRSGIPLKGIQVRDDVMTPSERDPYFEGTFKRTHHAYRNQELVTFDKGVYAIPGQAAYVGSFNYFGAPATLSAMGSFVFVGKKLTPDGKAETGIYISEEVYAGFAMHFVKATPEYLADFERRHSRAVQAYRQQQAEEAASDGFDFGQVLALGLGAAVIGSADLPGVDKIQLGQAFVSDVLGNGDGTATMNRFMSAMQGASGGDSLFSGGMDFQAPGLNGLLANLMPGSGGGPADGTASGAGAAVSRAPAAPAPVAAASSSGGGAARSETYSFSCPDGASYSIPVSYRNASRGAAMKNFARTYSCNLIGDFASAGQRCQQACGNAQCAEQ
ncbi:MAG: hypothetical protein ACFB13_07185 [Kiloniellaceae bacterium]